MTTESTVKPFDQDTDERVTKRAIGLVSKIGNLGKDPELKFSPKGVAYARTTLAVTRPLVKGDWKGEQVTDWYEITCFGSLAENAAECLVKGSRVIVAGRGEVETYIDKEGEVQTSRNIIADGIGPDLRWATTAITKTEFKNAKPTLETPDPANDEEPF